MLFNDIQNANNQILNLRYTRHVGATPPLGIVEQPPTCSGLFVMEEIWKDIVGYEGYYQISNIGNIRRWKRKLKIYRLVKPYPNKNGYLFYRLCVNGIQKAATVHRLVALHFVENPRKLNVVNHIDGIAKNNLYTNLEWCTMSENMYHAYRIGLKKVYSDRDPKTGRLIKKQINCKS